jgi:thiamine kinase-like enzyme
MTEDPDVEHRVRAYVSAVVDGCTPDRITTVRRLQPGENHDVFAVSLLGPEADDVVVRIATSERARDCTTAEREAAVLRRVQGDAAPFLHDFRCASPWFDVPTMCVQFIDGEQRPPADAADVQRLGSAVGRLHGLPTDGLEEGPAAALTLEDYLEARVAKLDERLPSIGQPLPDEAQLRLRQARSLLDAWLRTGRASGAFRHGDGLVLLHGDVAGGNIIWSPEPVLIDWEYARVGDAADEIAYVFNQNDLDEPDRQAFWRGYSGWRSAESSSALIERVRWWEPLTVLGSAFFWSSPGPVAARLTRRGSWIRLCRGKRPTTATTRSGDSNGRSRCWLDRGSRQAEGPRSVEVEHERRVVGRRLAPPRIAVDPGVGDPRRERRVDQRQVQAHAAALLEAEHAHLPERPRVPRVVGVGRGPGQQVGEPVPADARPQCLQGGSLGHGHVRPAVEDGRVPHVGVRRRDVEVPEQTQRTVGQRLASCAAWARTASRKASLYA